MKTLHCLLLLPLSLVACGDDDLVDLDGAVDALGLDGGGLDAPTMDALSDMGLVDGLVDDGLIVDAPIGADAGLPSGPPDAAGPFFVATETGMVGSTPVSICFPGLESAPLIVFAPGFMLQSSFYEATCQRLASHGFIVVRADPPAGFAANHNDMRDALIAVIDWALSESPVAGRIDASQIMTAGHSLGGKLATMVAVSDTRVTALFGIDPVDGGIGAPDVVPSQVGRLGIPVGFAGETTNGSGGFMPCAPSAQNFEQFFAGTTSASWAAQWEFPGADHMDFVPDTTGCSFCGVCTAGTADPAVVVADMHTLIVAFARRHLLADAGMEAWLRGPNMPARLTLMAR